MELGLGKMVQFLNRNTEFINCHMVEFIVGGLWDRLIPKDISDEILIDVDGVLNDLKSGEIGERFPKLEIYLNSMVTPFNIGVKNLDEIMNLVGIEDYENTFKFEHFMSDKKIHEVNIMASVVHLISKDLSHLIDIGDGKGYLSSLLALQYNRNVLGVDASEVNTKGSRDRLKKMQKYWNGLVKANEGANKIQSPKCNYKPITCFVTSNTNLTEILESNFNCNIHSIGLIGLHTCGNLASNSLRIFNNNSSIKILTNVGCCYHLLDDFPMSNYLKLQNFKLDRNARMLACQSLDRTQTEYNISQSLFYRAVLQIYFKRHGLKDCQVGRKCSKATSFREYVYCAMKKCNENHVVDENEVDLLFDEYFHWEKKLQIFYLIRMHFAGLIEKVILLDRVVFLHEMGHEKSFLVKLFDPVISPRHYAIISIKD